MEAKEILEDIFGESIKKESAYIKIMKDKQNKYINMKIIDNCIKNVLSIQNNPPNLVDKREGRLGPGLVRFDVTSLHGLFIVSPDRLSVNSQSNFSTIKANTGVFKGKWMYEVQLGSKGVMQIGWATHQCKFNQECGVGDTADSYSYDGNRMRKWNVTTQNYGDPWLSGDIIGSTIDMNEGTIDFYRNGKHLGRAFQDIPIGANIAYFPTFSLTYTENINANFGSTPLRYPVSSYEPLQALPGDKVSQMKLVLNWLSGVINLINDATITQERIVLSEGKTLTKQTYLMCLVGNIFKNAALLFTIPYVIEALFISFLRQLSLTDNKLTTCLDFIWTYLEEHEIKITLESTVLYLLSSFRHVSIILEYPDQCQSLILLTKICQHTKTRQYLLQYMLFDRVWFANFVHIKPLDEGGLAKIIDAPWWETNPIDPTVECNKKKYLFACQRIKSAINEVESLQVELLLTLLDNSDGTPKTPTSRTIFLKKFKRFVQDNSLTNSTIIPQTPLPITLCCFHRLLVAFRTLWSNEIGSQPVFIPCRVFYDGSIKYSGIDRLGGVLSHLNKTYKQELIDLLGADHEVLITIEQNEGRPNRMIELPMVIPAIARMINVNGTGQATSMILERMSHFPHNTRDDRITPMRLGPQDPALSLIELLDALILFYHVAGKKQIAKVATLRDSIQEYVVAVTNTKAKLESIKRKKDIDSQIIQKELHRTINVFNTRLSEQSRHMAWVRAAIYSEEKQGQLGWLLKLVTTTLTKASQENNMFSFVPEFYLEALADLCVGLRNHLHPTAPVEKIPDHQRLLLNIAEFLCQHFLDPRIVLANSKDTLILNLAGFMLNPLTLEALENVSEETRMILVNNLLKPYENRAWAQSNWVLFRFWQGNGFAFRYEKSPHLAEKIAPKTLQQESIFQPIKPYPSKIYQSTVKGILLSDNQATTKFLNSLLNQLNWAFSEFIGTVQEIHNVSSRPERVFIESRQLKICSACFELAVALLRVLEMIVTITPTIFNDPSRSSSENLLGRLCQLLCQVLNRMSSQTSSFQHVVLLEIPDLESVHHFPILAAVVGILLALLKEEISKFTTKSMTEVPKITRALLTEPSFQIDSLHFVLGDVKSKTPKTRELKPFSFLNYQNDVSNDEINRTKTMIRYLDSCRALLPESKLISEDDNTCTICYAFPIAATFKPCDHQSCRTCIDRHLLNTKECFFCKSTIDKVVDLSGNVFHDFTD